MKKRGKGSLLPEFVSPQDNPFEPIWQLPDAKTLVMLLKRHSGNLISLLSAVSEQDEDRRAVLFLINHELSKPENKVQQQEWQKLRDLHEETEMEWLKCQLIEDVKRNPDERLTDFGKNTKKPGDIKFLFEQKRRVEREKKGDKEHREMNTALIESLNAIKAKMEGPDPCLDLEAQAEAEDSA